MIVGIDLGTTNSLVGLWSGSAAVLIPNALGHLLTPSAVGLSDDGQILVGLAARERLVTHPTLTATAFKRYMGTDRLLYSGKKGFRAEELSALVLRSLKADAEAFLGEPVEEAVITVPAYFNDRQRKATKAAGELAGLRVKHLLTEPTAAALAYGLEAAGDERMILVADLGGGTFDVSVLQCFEGVMEVRAAAGDSWLGGEDFVDVIIAAFMAGPGREAGLPPPSEGAPIHSALRRQAELAKRKLSEASEATIEVVRNGELLKWRLTRDAFEKLSEPLLARVRGPIERALRDSRVDPDALSQIVLSGGASRMPMFRRLITRLFRRLPMQEINPEEVVARGAAMCAGLAMRDASLKEIVLTDVAPFTLGIAVSERDEEGSLIEGFFLPVIERNTIVPTSRVQAVRTARNNQPNVHLAIYQGESRLVRDNIPLGLFKVRVPRAPAGQQAINVRFTYDTSGLLEVEATVVSTGRKESLVIESNPGVLSREEITKRLVELSQLKVHPRDEAENITVVARANRLYEERLGSERQQIGDWLAQFMALLEKQDRSAIERARKRLNEFLDGIDQNFL